MKYSWRIGANSLKVIGSFGAADSRSNMLTFTGLWYNQLVELMKSGVRVEVESGDALVMELVEEKGVEVKVPEDLSQVSGHLCQNVAVEVLEVTSQEVVDGLKVQWVPDHAADSMSEFSLLVTSELVVTLMDKGAEVEFDREEADGGKWRAEEWNWWRSRWSRSSWRMGSWRWRPRWSMSSWTSSTPATCPGATRCWG
jgi:hypothetical protein